MRRLQVKRRRDSGCRALTINAHLDYGVLVVVDRPELCTPVILGHPALRVWRVLYGQHGALEAQALGIYSFICNSYLQEQHHVTPKAVSAMAGVVATTFAPKHQLQPFACNMDCGVCLTNVHITLSSKHQPVLVSQPAALLYRAELEGHPNRPFRLQTAKLDFISASSY